MKRGFLTLGDIPAESWPAVFDRAAHLKQHRIAQTLAGKSVALVFEKASTRTRVSFEVGVFELGGHAVVLSSQGSQIARGEPIEDTARVLSGYCHLIVLRTFGQDRVARLAKAASVPVVNGLSDQHHPCQVATDLFTVREKFGRIDKLRYAWVGDGNNMANSWIEAAGMFGLELALACPEGFAPDPLLVASARDQQARLGKGSITVTGDPRVAAAGAHVISTDVWASMGQEDDAERRRAAFAGFCVDPGLVQRGAADAIVLHCLPAHRGEEITGDVLDGPRSLAWVQAENRLHVGKAILEAVL
jgi:ornithine carbamoyltransferase